MLDLSTLLSLSDADLPDQDIAEVNLVCARGMPGADIPDDTRSCLRPLDVWAGKTETETARQMPHFHRQPEAYQRSEAYFRCLVMTTILQRDFGLHYRQELIELNDHDFFSRSENLFIHGVLAGKGGTCNSLPVVFVAVGRRLGYPLKLVRTDRHLFARWDDPNGERLNLECTSRGLNCHTDEYYLTWPFAVKPEVAKRYRLLVSLTARQELSHFLIHRGICFRENDRRRDAVGAFAAAVDTDPEDFAALAQLERAMNEWHRHLRSLKVLGFSSLTIAHPPPMYRTLPRYIENEINHLLVVENLLTDPAYPSSAPWLGLPPRQWAPAQTPRRVEVRYPQTSMEPPQITFYATKP